MNGFNSVSGAQNNNIDLPDTQAELVRKCDGRLYFQYINSGNSENHARQFHKVLNDIFSPQNKENPVECFVINEGGLWCIVLNPLSSNDSDPIVKKINETFILNLEPSFENIVFSDDEGSRFPER